MNEYYKFENTPLPYPYNSLESYIDTKTMELHHNNHLQTYINNLNDILKDYPALQKLSLTQLICYNQEFPKSIQKGIQDNAGGVYNHRFYFDGLINNDVKAPVGMLSNMIHLTYGSFDKFKELFKKAATSVFGSGYAWLVADCAGRLKIITTANQNTPLPENFYPILNIDVWEHAYYLKHYNKRADYIDDWFHVINWEKANENYLASI